MEVELGPATGGHGVEHGPGHQADELGPGYGRPGGHRVVGLGRTEPERVDQVHGHLGPAADVEA